MSDESSLSRRIWDGKYGWGRNSVLSITRQQFVFGGTVSAYASALYSIVTDFANWKFWWWPLRAIALWRLYWLLREKLSGILMPYSLQLRGVLRPWGTADECETITAILLGLSQLPIFSSIDRRNFRYAAAALAAEGLDAVTGGTSPHTRAFLLIHDAQFSFEKKTLEDTRHGLQNLLEAEVYADLATDPDQRSRCYRALAKAYYDIGEVLHPRLYIEKMQFVQGISESVRRKNAKARKRMGL